VRRIALVEVGGVGEPTSGGTARRTHGWSSPVRSSWGAGDEATRARLNAFSPNAPRWCPSWS
jgi:hypothetical protein